MNKKIIVILLCIIGISLIILGLFLKNMSTLPKYPYSGIYKYNDLSIYVYQEDNEMVYFGLDRDTRCRANIEEGSAKGACNELIEYNEYTLTIIDNNLKIESNSLKIPSGLYKRVSDITIEEYFNVVYGYAGFFKSEYNGMYKLDDKEIITYNLNDTMVVLIASSENSSFVTNLTINEDKTLSATTVGGILRVTFDNDGNLFFNINNDNSITNQFAGEYKKIRSIDYMDVLKNNTYYYYE